MGGSASAVRSPACATATAWTTDRAINIDRAQPLIVPFAGLNPQEYRKGGCRGKERIYLDMVETVNLNYQCLAAHLEKFVAYIDFRLAMWRRSDVAQSPSVASIAWLGSRASRGSLKRLRPATLDFLLTRLPGKRNRLRRRLGRAPQLFLQHLEEAGCAHAPTHAHGHDDPAHAAPLTLDQRVTDHARARHPIGVTD